MTTDTDDDIVRGRLTARITTTTSSPSFLRSSLAMTTQTDQPGGESERGAIQGGKRTERRHCHPHQADIIISTIRGRDSNKVDTQTHERREQRRKSSAVSSAVGVRDASERPTAQDRPQRPQTGRAPAFPARHTASCSHTRTHTSDSRSSS